MYSITPCICVLVLVAQYFTDGSSQVLGHPAFVLQALAQP